MDGWVSNLLNSGLRPNTKRSYSSAQQSYIRFAHSLGLEPLPCSESNLLRYLAYMDSRSLAPATMSIHVAAIRSLHVMYGYHFDLASSPRVKLLIKAVLDKAPPQAKKVPITLNILSDMLLLLKCTQDELLWRCVFLTAFCGALRGAEYAISFIKGSGWTDPLKVCSVFVNTAPVSITVNIPCTKTNRSGRKVHLPCVPNQLCPYCAMMRYLSYRQTSPPTTPLFVLLNGEILSKMVLNKTIQSLVACLGLDRAKFSSHSIRVGAVTSASAKGLGECELKELGDWSSQVYMTYIRSNVEDKVSTITRLMNNCPRV